MPTLLPKEFYPKRGNIYKTTYDNYILVVDWGANFVTCVLFDEGGVFKTLHNYWPEDLAEKEYVGNIYTNEFVLRLENK